MAAPLLGILFVTSSTCWIDSGTAVLGCNLTCKHVFPNEKWRNSDLGWQFWILGDYGFPAALPCIGDFISQEGVDDYQLVQYIWFVPYGV